MARSATKTSSKQPAGGKGQERGQAGRGGAAKKNAAQKNAAQKNAAQKNAAKKTAGAGSTKARAATKRAAKPASRQRPTQAGGWTAGVGALMGSQIARDVLAEILNAAAGVLRQNRQVGQDLQEAGRSMLDRSTDLASTTVTVGRDVASGAVEAGVEITAAAVDMAQTAAETLAVVSTEAVRSMVPGADVGGDEGRGAGREGRDRGEES